jgi:hypothetical protein
MFIEQEPQIPSRQERRKVRPGSMLVLDLDERVEDHRAAGVEIHVEPVVAGIVAAVRIVAVDLERLDPLRAGRGGVRLALPDLAVLRKREFGHLLFPLERTR